MRRSGHAIRIEVTDGGGPWLEAPGDCESGRGLDIVAALSARRGIAIEGPARNPYRRTVWLEVEAP